MYVKEREKGKSRDELREKRKNSRTEVELLAEPLSGWVLIK